jgi:N-acetylglucosaminyl-diphospho-decaprenol L-rhamnosyltransferase
LSSSVDVVIPTYGGWEFTRRCLGHLRRQTIEHLVIVADNASPDGTASRVREAFPDVCVVGTGGNHGFAIACNRGAAAGEGEIVVLVNNDVECRPDFLEKIVAPFEDERVGLVAGTLVKPDGKTLDGVGITADVTLAGFARLHNRPLDYAGSQRPTPTGPSGGAAAYRRVAWEAVGGFDERIFIYSEDLDLAFRIRAAGWDVAIASDAIGIHLGSATMGVRSSWQRYQAAFSRGYLLRRYGVLTGSVTLRALASEAVVVVGDAVLSRDLSAFRGRVAGWRHARGLPRLEMPPLACLDTNIGFRESLRLRRIAYFE